MTDSRSPLPLEVAQAARALGGRIRVARSRRQMSQDELAQACGVSRKTLAALEAGAPGVALSTLLAALWKLGLLSTAAAVADPDSDEHGRILEAARRPQRVRSPTVADNDF